MAGRFFRGTHDFKWKGKCVGVVLLEWIVEVGRPLVGAGLGRRGM